MRRMTVRWLPVVLAGLTCLYALALPGSAGAYFDLGTVAVTTGSSSVAVTAGSTATVSVAVSPASKAELPGCGMATCPDDCGPGCLDANGQCTCGGTTYTTYTTSVSVSSSNTAVARASYSGGVLRVTGVGAGSATITITASLRQYSNGSAAVQVTAGAAKTPTPTPTPRPTSSKSSKPASRKPGGKSGSSGSGGSPGSGGGGVTRVVTSGGHGRSLLLVRLRGTIAPAAALDRAAAKGLLVTFWTGPSAAHPTYSWTFDGRRLPRHEAGVDLGIDTATSVGGTLGRMIQGRDCLVLGFSHNGALPAPAVVRLRVGSTYVDGETVTLYLFDAQHSTFVRQARDLSVQGGFVSFPLRHCSIYVLSTVGDLCCLSTATLLGSGPAGSSGGGHSLMTALVVALAVAAAVAAGALVLLRRRSPARPQAASRA